MFEFLSAFSREKEIRPSAAKTGKRKQKPKEYMRKRNG